MAIAYYAALQNSVKAGQSPGPRFRNGLKLAALCFWFIARSAAQTDWPAYGHDPGGQQYSPLKQINTGNISKLQVAWTYDIRPKAAPGSAVPRNRASQSTPLVVGSVMYLSTPYSRVLALDAETGRR